MNVIDQLLDSDEHGRWVHEFQVRGRTYTMRMGSFSCGAHDARFSVFNSAGRPTAVTVRDTDKVVILSRKGTIELYPTQVSA